MARMGQCFSTSMDAVGIDVNEGTSWEMNDDIKTPNGGYCFSDGVGRISESLARQVRIYICSSEGEPIYRNFHLSQKINNSFCMIRQWVNKTVN